MKKEPDALEHAVLDEAVEADSASADLVELVLQDHALLGPKEAPKRIDGVVVGQLAAIAEDGRPLVVFDERPGDPIAARAALAFGPGDIGRPCALLFEGADPSRPILMGWMFERAAVLPEAGVEVPADSRSARSQPSVEQDGERVVFEADKEIVLRCGKASITLTRAGKILIRGAYLLARSSGVNRIQGGSVQIN